MHAPKSNEPSPARWKVLIAFLCAAGNTGLAFYAFMPMGAFFAMGASIGRAIGAPLLVVALFQIGKRFRSTNSRYNIFLVTSILVALASVGRIMGQPVTADVSPREIVSASLPNLNQDLPETLDNGMRIERYESEGEKLVGNFSIVDSDKMDINSDFWAFYLSKIKALACVEPSYKRMLERGVIFEYRIRDQEGNLVATVQTSLSDCHPQELSSAEQKTSVPSESLNNNVELVNPDAGVFRVLGFVDIQPSGEAIQLWHAQDFQHSNGVGTQFSGFDEDQSVFRSLVLVLDSSANEYEPSIAEMSVEDAVRFDEELYKRKKDGATESQTEISEWLSSSLNEPEDFPGTKYLATAYKLETEEGTMLVFEVRATIDDRNAYIFSIADADDEAVVAQNVAMLTMAVVVSQSRFAQ